MSSNNPLWGAPRIHGELLKLGIDIGQTSVGKYIVRRRKPPSQNWRTFLENRAKSMVLVDFFTVPTRAAKSGDPVGSLLGGDSDAPSADRRRGGEGIDE
jgi:hypothetical protein